MNKAGFDVHGTVDRYPQLFNALGALLVSAGVEVHIITGSPAGPKIEKELADAGMVKGQNYTHFFSVVDYNKENFHNVETDEQGNFWMDIDQWNRTKGDYCEREGIDFIFDDSEVYHEHFDLTRTMYCHLK